MQSASPEAARSFDDDPLRATAIHARNHTAAEFVPDAHLGTVRSVQGQLEAYSLSNLNATTGTLQAGGSIARVRTVP